MNIKMTNLNICLLLCLFISPDFNIKGNNPQRHKLHHDDAIEMTMVQKEAYLIQLIHEFLDVKNYPNEKFSSFARDIIILLETADRSRHELDDKTRKDIKDFCQILKKMETSNKPRIVGLNLVKYRHLLPKQAKEAIQNIKRSELESILEKRIGQ